MAKAEKCSLAIDKEVLAWARKTAVDQEVSLSAFVSQALRRAKQDAAWGRYMGGFDPPITEEELAEASTILAEADRAGAVRWPSDGPAAAHDDAPAEDEEADARRAV